MNEQQNNSGADSANSADKDFNEEVNRRLEHGTDADTDPDKETPGDDAAAAFRQQRDEDEDSVLEKEDDEGNPSDPESEAG